MPPEEPTDDLARFLARARDGRMLFLTGAGISAESGIVTFRGTDGYWVVGSRNWTPQEMATAHMFAHSPEEVWRWYLMRFGRCQKAEPNPAHHALVKLERHLGARFTLVTQNIDALHHRAGSTTERTLCIHGDARFTRCAAACTEELFTLRDFGVRDSSTPLSETDRQQLRCPRCQDWLRPHVLWFDEYYDETHYRADSAQKAAHQADVLVSVGTTGTTSLPYRIARICEQSGAAVLDVNPEPNPFSELAERSTKGLWLRGPATTWVPRIVEGILSKTHQAEG